VFKAVLALGFTKPNPSFEQLPLPARPVPFAPFCLRRFTWTLCYTITSRGYEFQIKCEWLGSSGSYDPPSTQCSHHHSRAALWCGGHRLVIAHRRQGL